MWVKGTSINWRTAHGIALASMEHAERSGLNICVSVLDASGYPLAQLRSNKAAFPCAAISSDKAFTAVSFGFATSEWVHRLEDRPNLLSGLSQQERMVTFGGGLPLKYNGETVGAIGVSGASESQDCECAEAGRRLFCELAESGGLTK